MAGNKQTVIVESKTVGFGKSQKKVKGLNSALGGLAVKAMGVAGAYFGARGIINALKSSMTLYAEQQLAEVKLEAALGKTSIGLQKYASALQKTTRFGDELILQGMAQLAFFIKDEEQIKIATQATLDLASAKGMDLVQAADLVAKSVGSSTNALSRYGIAAVGAVGSQERLLSITDAISDTFGGQAVATTQSYQGAMDQLSNSFGDMQEVIGEKLAPSITKIAKGLTKMLSVPVSKEIKNEAFQFDNLLNTIKRLNPESEIRTRLIKEINDEYPSYIKNLDLEKASLEEINEFQAEAKEHMLARITIAMNEEKIADALQAREDAATDLVTSQTELTAKTAEYNEALLSGSGVQAGWGAAAGFTTDTTAHLSVSMSELSAEVDSANNEFDKQSKILENLTTNQSEAVTEAENLVNANKDIKKTITSDDETTTPLGPTDDAIKDATTRHQSFLDIIADQELEASITAHQALQGRQTFSSDIEQAKLLADVAALDLSEAEKQEIYDYYDELRREQVDAANEHDAEIAMEQRERNVESMNMALDAISTITDALLAGVNRRANAEISALKDTDKYRDADADAQEDMIDDINDKYEAKRKALFFADKAVALSEVYINTALAVTKAGSQLGAFSIPMATYLTGLGIAQAAVIAAQPFPEYAQGGLIGGALHSQGGTVIEAEQGEFVMNRDAVESIGVDTLENMNQGGGGINIQISGNVMTDEFVEGELAEKIADAVRRGTDFGIS